MKRIITALLLVFMAYTLQAQNNLSDSLKSLLAKETRDTSKVKLLIRLNAFYIFSFPDTAMQYAEEGLALSQKIGFSRGEANCLNQIGNVHLLTGNYPKALDAFLQALKINERINNQLGISLNLGNIGSLYIEQGDYRQGIDYTLKSKIISESLHRDQDILIDLLNVGDSYEKLNKLDSARIYTQQAYELALRTNDIDYTGAALNNLGNIHSKMNQDALAMEYYRLGIPYVEQADNDHVMSETTLGIARLFQKSAQLDSAVYYAKLSLASAEKAHFTLKIFNASSFLSSIYQQNKMIDSAYNYLQLTMAAKDSLFSQEKVKQVQNLSFNEHLRQQELAEQRLLEKENRKKNLQLLGIAAFIPTFFGILLILSKRKVRPRTIELLGVIGLLLLFEFITMFIHPVIAHWTHELPVFMLLASVIVAFILAPAHHKLEHWMKEKLVHKPVFSPPPVILSSQTEQTQMTLPIEPSKEFPISDEKITDTIPKT